MNIFTTRLDNADSHCAAMQADIDSQKTQVLNLTTDATSLPASLTTAVTNTVPYMSVNEVAREVYLRSSKMSNIVISGLQSSEVSNTTQAHDLLHDELDVLTKTVTSHTLYSAQQV